MHEDRQQAIDGTDICVFIIPSITVSLKCSGPGAVLELSGSDTFEDSLPCTLSTGHCSISVDVSLSLS